ncbi:hypothetical protein [Metabacillus fastidiosus]|uniref:hypothetical protein n=1 Tax=Metabacillus fastidiosus TaxID=1458 RepID=UPI003D2C43BB
MNIIEGVNNTAPNSTVPDLNSRIATANQDGEFVFSFKQDEETGGIGQYDFAMESATVEFNVPMNNAETFLVTLDGVGSYGEIVFNGMDWVLIPYMAPQTFQTPGTFILRTTVTDLNMNIYNLVFKIVVVSG